MSNSYVSFHIDLLKQTYNHAIQFMPFASQELGEDEQSFLEQFTALIEAIEQQSEDVLEQGQALLTRWIRNYPELVPIIPRDLLWYFGGDCLHYMPDEEIDKFQLLDEKRHLAESEGKDFEYARERAVILELAH
ncbi:PA2817 family protein [Neptunomonas phycophila]|uniref:PA2817 family protein n=1 Tax=Neptunomonas phycophila TaxID=1572645 RepID=A0ABT9EUG1_9GAMM|nr:PA2817 family protein [Neptunomonas phycophila]MBT3146560.1 dehydrogenase [Neptunomonas phycophila]MDO6784990.1 PA2817 family protein [Neptunomonas phycophila]MDP2522705.1 PA2817 family protein [Neptunomonas phycophila]